MDEEEVSSASSCGSSCPTVTGRGHLLERFDDVSEPLRGNMIKAIEGAMQQSLRDATGLVELAMTKPLGSDVHRVVGRLARDVAEAERLGFDVEQYKGFFVDVLSRLDDLDRIRLYNLLQV